MIRLLLIYTALATGLFSVACSSHAPGTETGSKTMDSAARPAAPVAVVHRFRQFETGKVIHHIASLQDRAESFSLYLPKDYDTAKSWPVVYFIDAHARGKLPLN